MEKSAPEGTRTYEAHGTHYAQYLHHIASGATAEEALLKLTEKLVARGIIE